MRIFLLIVFAVLALSLLIGNFATSNVSESPQTTESDETEPKTTESDKPKRRELDGKVNFDGAMFYIANLEERDWENCRFKVNGKYDYPSGSRISRIEAQTIYSIGAGQFTLSNGTRFNPFTTKPQRLFIDCNNGDAFWFFD